MSKETINKIKVAVIHVIPAPYRTSFFALLAKRPEIDLTVYFCAKKQAGRYWETDLNGFNFKFLRNFGWATAGKFYINSFHINPGIISELLRGKFDLIVISGVNHFTMQIGILWSWLTKTPYIMWNESHHIRVKNRGLIRQLTKKILYKPIFSWASACFTAGSYARDYVVSYGANPDRVFIVANTPDIHWFMRESSKHRQNKNKIKIQMGINQKNVILFVGGLYETKGIQYLIDAYSKIKMEQDDVCLLILGDGPLRSRLESYCAQKNIGNVCFAGFQQINELPKYYSISDVFVLPSIHETWGTVVNEAMACGLPIITSRTVGASGDLIKSGENGFIVQERNVEELYKALKEIISQPDLALAMGNMSKRIIEPWDHEHSVEEFINAVQVTCRH